MKRCFSTGNPGTGKTFISGLAMSFAVCNGAVVFLTSLPSRRADQLYGQHIHKLFKISTLKLDPISLANKALTRISHDKKRFVFLKRLQVLFIKEIGLITAQLFTTVDFISRNLKDTNGPFGGVLIVGNGDSCQLPNIDGSSIFEASYLLFNTDFHFLTHFVRMVDPQGQKLLRVL